ncbi:hypothetical protein [Serratia liquefaciens]|uniref:hypothetical protein n=1 Tax=Serratia liquefaciens TaxID=614 RepID=UPI0021C6F1B0|nr:hypothetical protein [Serratia liquefaciens]
MSEIDELKSELAKIRGELVANRAAIITIFREIKELRDPEDKSRLMFKFINSGKDLGIDLEDPNVGSPTGFFTKQLLSLDSKK